MQEGHLTAYRAPSLDLTIDQVLEAARARGANVSREQLKRWRRKGLVPSGKVEAGGTAGGSRSLLPASTVDVLIKVARLRDAGLDLDDIGWRLWWKGSESHLPFARKLLSRIATNLDAEVSRMRQLVEAEAGGDPNAESQMEQLRRSVRDGRIDDPFMRGMRKRAGADGATTVLQYVLLVGSGLFDDFGHGGDAEANLLETGLGLDRARIDTLESAVPWLVGEIEPHLRDLSRMLRDTTWSEIAAVDPTEVVAARDRVRAAIPGLSAFMALARIFAGKSFGLAALTEMSTSAPRLERLAVLITTRLCLESELREGMDEIVAAVSSVGGSQTRLWWQTS